MANPGLPDEEIMQTVAAVNEFGSIRNTHLNIGMSRSAIKRRIEIALERGLISGNPTLPGFEITKISTTEDADGNVKSRSIQQKPEVEQPTFKMPDGFGLQKLTAQVDGEGRIKQQWLKADLRAQETLSVIEATKEAMQGLTGSALRLSPPKTLELDHVSIIPLVDWHIGLMAWAEETGENYDLKIAEKIIMDAMARVISLTPPSKECVVLGLGDMLHADGYEPVTSRSKNVLDVDGRYPKVLKTAIRMIVATIQLALQNHEIVHVRILPGNHDDQSALAIGIALSMYFENQERVRVDDSPSRFWWKRFGKVFLGATHGDKAKMKDLPLVMAHDRPHDWAASTHRKVYTGHIHHERTIEEGGVIVSSMRSPVAKDAYHSFEKYRAGRSVYSETFNINGSMAGRTQINI